MSDQPNVPQEFIRCLEVMADNKFVLGDRLVEIGISAPEMEAKLACISLAQSELGHARILYNWAQDLSGQTDPEDMGRWNIDNSGEIRQQTGKAFEEIVNVDGWIDLIAAICVAETALDIVIDGMIEARPEEMKDRMHKLIKEQEEPLSFAMEWGRKLLNDRGRVPEAFEDAIESMLPSAREWLQSLDESKTFHKGGFFPERTEFEALFHDRIENLRATQGTAEVG